jgi:hypothetical protein
MLQVMQHSFSPPPPSGFLIVLNVLLKIPRACLCGRILVLLSVQTVRWVLFVVGMKRCCFCSSVVFLAIELVSSMLELGKIERKGVFFSLLLCLSQVTPADRVIRKLFY